MNPAPTTPMPTSQPFGQHGKVPRSVVQRFAAGIVGSRDGVDPPSSDTEPAACPMTRCYSAVEAPLEMLSPVRSRRTVTRPGLTPDSTPRDGTTGEFALCCPRRRPAARASASAGPAAAMSRHAPAPERQPESGATMARGQSRQAEQDDVRLARLVGRPGERPRPRRGQGGGGRGPAAAAAIDAVASRSSLLSRWKNAL